MLRLLALTACLFLAAPTAVDAYQQRGKASWYGPGFHGKTMANGKRYNMNAPTVAHRTLPFGTRVKITNRDNGRVAFGRVTDRGPYARGRKIDVSRAIAKRLRMLRPGIANVTIKVLPRRRR